MAYLGPLATLTSHLEWLTPLTPLATHRVGSNFTHSQIYYTKKENKSTLPQIAIFLKLNQRRSAKTISLFSSQCTMTSTSFMDIPMRSSSGWVCLHSYFVESRGTFTHMWWMAVNVWRYFRQDYTLCPKLLLIKSCSWSFLFLTEEAYSLLAMQVYNPPEICQAHSQHPSHSMVPLEKSLMWLRTSGPFYDTKSKNLRCFRPVGQFRVHDFLLVLS